MLTFCARVDLEAMAMKEYSAFPKLQHYWSLTIRLLSVIFPGHSLVVFFSSAAMQSVYSTAPNDWAIGHFLREFYHHAEMQSMYSTVPANWGAQGRYTVYEYETLLLLISPFFCNRDIYLVSLRVWCVFMAYNPLFYVISTTSCLV